MSKRSIQKVRLQGQWYWQICFAGMCRYERHDWRAEQLHEAAGLYYTDASAQASSSAI
jgi:hypothetical protein|nr:hypothetical protein [uncultured Mediterranean phage uvMED]